MQQPKYRREHAPKYDSFLYPAAGGPTRQQLFAPRQGAGIFQTNLIKDGSLSGENDLEVEAIRFIPDPAADPRDTSALMGGYLRAAINETDLARFHLWDLPGGVGVHLAASQGGEVAAGGAVIHRFAANGTPDIRNIRVLAEPFTIEPNEAFFVECVWPAALTLQAATRFWVYLDGVETKPRI